MGKVELPPRLKQMGGFLARAPVIAARDKDQRQRLDMFADQTIDKVVDVVKRAVGIIDEENPFPAEPFQIACQPNPFIGVKPAVGLVLPTDIAIIAKLQQGLSSSRCFSNATGTK